MYETYTTVIGTVISEPRRRQTNTGEEVISFRVACNSRRMDRSSGEWTDGPTLYLTLSCWRRLLTGVGLAVAKGRPIIAHGQIRTNEYVTADGDKRSDLEMTATAVGLDLSRCVVSYQGTSAFTDTEAAGSVGGADGAANPDDADPADQRTAA
ncbi:single-stranded DNA-binding protein [Gordonia rhizosphera]|uniref:Putative single-stranded DNA-binding protein n=1 Tax=Gordonia rhizosphera NBRC 16068 TaxID=1108045 RepID=K6W397_9ACTN|nr:single-stranded DNA-binding protein [Gordonia rhizosphera]GAB88191.1 putative single-stranded DNA-binding protein [Gordonia rhizosphera NBRC 16068]